MLNNSRICDQRQLKRQVLGIGLANRRVMLFMLAALSAVDLHAVTLVLGHGFSFICCMYFRTG